MGSLKLDLMQYHLEYAVQIGINGKELLHYTIEQALSTTLLWENFIFLIDDESVGMAFQTPHPMRKARFKPMVIRYVHPAPVNFMVQTKTEYQSKEIPGQ